MRLGVLGGSFNPPHNGHVVLAGDAHEALGLDRLLVVPAAANPLKREAPGSATPLQRLEMARLAFAGDSRFEVSSMEIERGGLSYTVDTLEALARSHPGTDLVLLIGVDALETMPSWKRPERIRELAQLGVLEREGRTLGERERQDSRITVVTTRRVDISSTEIRERLAQGKSILGFVPESVERYISAAKLYGSGGGRG